MIKPAATATGAVLALSVAAVAMTGAGLASSEVGPVGSTHVVEIRQLRFRPAGLAVSEGDTVVWVNRDVVPHTVAALDSSWGSGALSRGESWRRVVGAEGVISYFCEYHPMMRGNLLVR